MNRRSFMPGGMDSAQLYSNIRCLSCIVRSALYATFQCPASRSRRDSARVQSCLECVIGGAERVWLNYESQRGSSDGRSLAVQLWLKWVLGVQIRELDQNLDCTGVGWGSA